MIRRFGRFARWRPAALLAAAALGLALAPSSGGDEKKDAAPSPPPQKGAGHEWLELAPDAAKANGRHVVLLSGDEEARSEESLPMLARILAQQHGFRCTVLFFLDGKTGAIDPNEHENIPGFDAVKTADLLVMNWRFRELPEEKLKMLEAHWESGKPVLALRSSLVAFANDRGKPGLAEKFDWRSRQISGGFGAQVLGAGWAGLLGRPDREATLAVVEDAARNNPLLRGMEKFRCESAALQINRLPEDAEVLLRAKVLAGTSAEAKPAEDSRNAAPPPLAWRREYRGRSGASAGIVALTAGTARDFLDKNLRLLVVNACHHLLGLPVPENAAVDLPAGWQPSPSGFNAFRKNLKPKELAR
jgi:hypothetical protein